MSIVFLFWHEEEVSCPVHRPVVDQFMAMFGYEMCQIDTGKTLNRKNNTVFDSLEDARYAPRFLGYSWVFFDGAGAQFLDDFDHPENNVVYVTGSDLERGYGRSINNLWGPVLKLRTVNLDRHDWHAFPTILTAVCDRWTRFKF